MAHVYMKQLRFGNFPKVFIANGVEYVVQSIERCWTAGKTLGFRVHCGNKTLELYHDTKTDAWTMAQ